jgi:hypothetical protein
MFKLKCLKNTSGTAFSEVSEFKREIIEVNAFELPDFWKEN